MSDEDLRKHRYDMATIPGNEQQRDPSLIFGVVKQLVAARGEIGDLIVIHCPPGTGTEASRYISKQLEARDTLPGLPGGPGL